MDFSESDRVRDARLDRPAEMRDEERLDPLRIAPFVRAALPDAAGPITILQFPNGHSNLTYLLRIGDREVVLRRPPFGVTVKSAHDMKREFDILSALEDVYPRAPKPIVFCDDESLIGAKFYLMERVRGVILRSNAPPPGITFSPELLRNVSTALVDNLVDLHAVDISRPPLSTMGRPQGYVARQVAGWTERYRNAKTDEVPGIDAVAAWLSRNMPKESGVAVIHNDYKYDNVVLDPDDPSRVVSVLDWEMATIGDPLMDLGTFLGYWADPDDPEELRLRAYGPTSLTGNLSRAQLVDRYAQKSGRPVGDILFYYVFALFKIAVILQQIYKRYAEGHTHDPRFATLGNRVRVLAHQAERALQQGRIDRLRG
jgi:aminoglycoside phosphotransferase (APT) family kinase protein